MSTSYSSNALQAVCSNLAKACEKQFRTEESQLFHQLADYFGRVSPQSGSAEIEQMEQMITHQLSQLYPEAESHAVGHADRGAQRALVWGKKVTSIHKSLMKRVLSAKNPSDSTQHYYVCEACGFIALAESAPERCPICKAPSLRFTQIA
jgi:rubrerythrin